MQSDRTKEVALERFKLLSDVVRTWLGAIALILGGGFAIVQYIEKEKADRIKVSLDFFDRYNKSPFYDSRQRIERAWEKNDVELDKILSANPMDRRKYSKFITTVAKQENIEYDIFQLIAFFESLEICIRSAICDSSAAVSFLHSDAQAFYRLHFSVIHQAREFRGDPSIGRDLESLIGRK